MSRERFDVLRGKLCKDKEAVQAWEESVGKKIVRISVVDNICRIEFPAHVLKIFDDGQDCCERRFMVCDDKLDAFIGGELLGATIEDAPRQEGDYDVHEVQFLHVKTTKGSFAISNHNEHNGYYGGFWIVARIEGKDGAS